MLNWDDLRYFLAVARNGSLSAAAVVLEVTQPTVGRRIAAFERALGTKLFVSTRLGRELSRTGQELLAHAERMELDALAAERSASGRDLGVRGSVCVTATEWVVHDVLAPLVASFVSRYSELELELVADVRHLNLTRREADVALRTSRFEHDDVVQRKLALVRWGLYASDSYLARYGAPDFERGCAGHRLVAMSASVKRVVDVEWLARIAGQAEVAIRTNGRRSMATLASAGLGMACLPRFVGDKTLGLRLLRPPAPEPERSLWLGVHRDVHGLPRIRATVGFLAEAIGRLETALAPAPMLTAASAT